MGLTRILLLAAVLCLLLPVTVSALQCYRCSDCATPSNSVTCPSGDDQCYTVKYSNDQTAGETKVARGCSKFADDSKSCYDYVPTSLTPSGQVFQGLHPEPWTSTCSKNGCGGNNCNAASSISVTSSVVVCCLFLITKFL